MIDEKIGVRAHDLGKMPVKEMADCLRRHGFLAPQLVLPKVFSEVGSYEEVNEEMIEEIWRHLEGIRCSVFGCYRDLSNPNPEIRLREVELVQRMIPFAKMLGARVVGSETSYGNLSEEEKKQLYPGMLDSIQRIVETAAYHDMPFAIEPVRIHPLDTPEVLNQVIRAAGDEKHLRVIFDVQNVLAAEDIRNQAPGSHAWIQAAGSCIDVLHIKDFTCDKEGNRKPAVLGTGLVDYSVWKDWAHQTPHSVTLVREWLQTDHIREEWEYLKQF